MGPLAGRKLDEPSVQCRFACCHLGRLRRGTRRGIQIGGVSVLHRLRMLKEQAWINEHSTKAMTVPIPKTSHMRRLRVAFEAGRELSAHDAEHIAHLHIRRVREYLKWLHQQGEIHIDRWERRHKQGPWHPVYAGGPGPDAQRPAGKTNAEMMRSYRERRRIPKPEPILQAIFSMRTK